MHGRNFAKKFTISPERLCLEAFKIVRLAQGLLT